MENAICRAALDTPQIDKPCSSDIGLRTEVALERNEVEVGLEPIVARAGGIAKRSLVVGREFVGLPIDDPVSGAMGCDLVDEALQEALQSIRAERFEADGIFVVAVFTKDVCNF